MSPMLRMILVGLVTFGLGFVSARWLSHDAGGSLEWERQGETIRLTPSSADTAYLVVGGMDGTEGDVPAGDPVGYHFGPLSIRATTGGVSVYEIRPLLVCGEQLQCNPCRVAEPDDCPAVPPPPPPPFHSFAFLAHASFGKSPY